MPQLVSMPFLIRRGAVEVIPWSAYSFTELLKVGSRFYFFDCRTFEIMEVAEGTRIPDIIARLQPDSRRCMSPVSEHEDILDGLPATNSLRKALGAILKRTIKVEDVGAFEGKELRREESMLLGQGHHIDAAPEEKERKWRRFGAWLGRKTKEIMKRLLQ